MQQAAGRAAAATRAAVDRAAAVGLRCLGWQMSGLCRPGSSTKQGLLLPLAQQWPATPRCRPGHAWAWQSSSQAAVRALRRLELQQQRWQQRRRHRPLPLRQQWRRPGSSRRGPVRRGGGAAASSGGRRGSGGRSKRSRPSRRRSSRREWDPRQTPPAARWAAGRSPSPHWQAPTSFRETSAALSQRPAAPHAPTPPLWV